MASTPRPSQPDEKDLGPDDSVSMVSTSTVQTPTSSSASTSNRSTNIPYITHNSAPGPGSTYIIVHKHSGENKALAVVEGRLNLATPPELLSNPPVFDSAQAKAFAGTCNWHWHCRESDGWLGFRNAATGLWLGASGIGISEDEGFKMVDLEAAGSGLGVDEQFCVRKAEDDEGYLLLKRVDLKDTGYFRSITTVHLWPAVCYCAMSWAISVKTTHAKKRELNWEFVKVDLDSVSGRKMDGNHEN